MWRLIADIYKQGVASLYRQISKRYSNDRLPDDKNLIYIQSCDSVFMSDWTYKTGQNFVYSQSLPHRALNIHDARPQIVDTPLTLISKMGQGACRFLNCLKWRPILWLCLTTTKSLFNHLTYQTKNHCRSIDIHVWDGAGSVLLSRSLIKAGITLIMYDTGPVAYSLACLQAQKSLMLRWWSFLGDGSDVVSRIFTY